MKKANRNYRREMLAAEKGKEADIKRYPLNNGGSVNGDNGESITIYSDDNVSIMCSPNLLGLDNLRL